MLILVMSSYYMGLTDKIFRKVTFSEGQKGSGFLFLQRRRAKVRICPRTWKPPAIQECVFWHFEGEEKRRCEGKFSLISSAFHSSIVERSWDAMSRTIEKMGRGVDNE